MPWELLPALFQQHASEYNTKRDACSKIWNIVEPTLSAYLRRFAENFNLLRKTKADITIDKALRDTEIGPQDFINYDIDDADPADIDLESEDPLDSLREEFRTEVLVAACHSAMTSLHRNGLHAARGIPSLISSLSQVRLSYQVPLPLEIFRHPSYPTSGLKYVSSTTLQDLESQIKCFNKRNTIDPITDQDLAFEVDDFNFSQGDGVLRPTLNSTEGIPNLADRRSQVGDNPSGATLTELVKKDLPLNKKQGLIVERVLSGALAWKDHSYDASQREQMLLYIGGEGGVGKSRVIKAIVAGMDLIERKDEIILLAPTGAAADNIDGNTIHSSLGIGIISQKQRVNVSPRVKKLWSRITIMIIDEISMVHLTQLSVINNHCKMTKSLDRSSPDFFGGLPIVIFMGDFFQFPPINGPSLWASPRKDNDEDANGQMIWHRFRNVIILDQQMRQAEDPTYQSLLGRARAGTLTTEDCNLLNKKSHPFYPYTRFGKRSNCCKI